MPEDTKYVNRLVNMIRRIVRSELPTLTFLGAYEYSIQNVSGDLVDVSPTDTTIGLPALASIPMRSGLLGEKVTPSKGKNVIVIFVNGQPSRPIIVSAVGAPEESTITTTGDLNLEAGGQTAQGHAVTLEALVLMLYNFVPAIGTALAALSPPVTVTNSTTLGALFLNTLLSPQMITALNAMLATQSIPPPGIAPPPNLNTSAVFAAAIESSLQAKLPNITGLFPGVGCPAIKQD